LAREAARQLFIKWVSSEDKDKARAHLMRRSGTRSNETVDECGYFSVDLDTPAVVLREFVRRYCGRWLNEHAKGEHFVMENSKGVVIRRDKEGAGGGGGKLGSLTAMDMVQEQVNKKTRVMEPVLFVQDE
ncbi:unnamed protein product, partial [Discosporangium mesarthrocarpum]